MHLCGNSSHLFGMIRRELNVTAFDTGFPVDHGKIRRELGPEVEIAGGPPVDLLMNGTPDEVYQRTKAILLSGVKEGGRFTLREGNNLPPSTPMSNLAAMYQAALDHGHY
jgi:uroporphyrinogen-III decarboxylase